MLEAAFLHHRKNVVMPFDNLVKRITHGAQE